MRAFLALLSLALVVGCSNMIAYDGPVALDPFISVDTRMVLDSLTDPLHPRYKHTGIAEVTNPSNNEIEVDIDCDITMVSHLVLPPRATTRFFLNPNDRICRVIYSRY